MINQIRTYVALAASAVLLACAPAFASFETATPGTGTGDYPIYTDAVTGNGDGTDAGSNFIGATFSVGSGVTSLTVGTNVDAFGSGQVFGEIVAVAPTTTSLPPVTGTGSSALINWLQGSANLGVLLLSAPTTAGDVSSVINFANALTPGNYAVIFGSGLYGTTGELNLTGGNATVGTPNIFASLGGDGFTSVSSTDSDIRIFASPAASPVPLPAGLPLLASGLVAGWAMLRRRRGVFAAQV